MVVSFVAVRFAGAFPVLRMERRGNRNLRKKNSGEGGLKVTSGNVTNGPSSRVSWRLGSADERRTLGGAMRVRTLANPDTHFAYSYPANDTKRTRGIRAKARVCLPASANQRLPRVFRIYFKTERFELRQRRRRISIQKNLDLDIAGLHRLAFLVRMFPAIERFEQGRMEFGFEHRPLAGGLLVRYNARGVGFNLRRLQWHRNWRWRRGDCFCTVNPPTTPPAIPEPKQRPTVILCMATPELAVGQPASLRRSPNTPS